MGSPLFLVSFVEALNKLGELVWYAFIDDIRVHGPELLTEFVLNIRTQPALLALCFVGSHGRFRRLPHFFVHLTLPPVPKHSSRGIAASLIGTTCGNTIGSLGG